VAAVIEPLPFEQRADESPQAFAAFAVYRDMHADRSVDHVAQKLGKSHTIIGRWSKRHEWVDRARSYDAALDAKARHATEQQAIEQRRKMLDEHAEEARNLRKLARRLVTEFERRYDEKGTLQYIGGDDFIKMVGQLPKIVETAQKLERLAAGEATDRHEHMITREEADQMTDDEFDALLRARGLE
jgi:hypothetical protein